MATINVVRSSGLVTLTAGAADTVTLGTGGVYPGLVEVKNTHATLDIWFRPDSTAAVVGAVDNLLVRAGEALKIKTAGPLSIISSGAATYVVSAAGQA